MPKLSKEDVVAKLTELEVEFDPKATYSELLALLKEEETPEEKEEITQEKPEEKVEEVEEVKEDEAKKPINPFQSFDAKTPMTGKAIEMKKILDSQPKEHIMIPLGPEEKMGSTHQVTLNGYTMFIIKGMMVEVPQQVAKVLNAKLEHQRNVREHPLKVGGVEDIKLQKFD